MFFDFSQEHFQFQIKKNKQTRWQALILYAQYSCVLEYNEFLVTSLTVTEFLKAPAQLLSRMT